MEVAANCLGVVVNMV